MASVLTETFEGGTNGTAMTTGNTAFNQLVQAGWTFSTAQAAVGSLSGRCQVSSAASIATATFTAAAALYGRFFLYVATRPAALIAIGQYTSVGTMRAELQLGPNGQLRMRNSGTVAIHTAPDNTTPLGGWCRVEWSYSNTAAQQRLRVFTGANLFGSTPDYDSGTVTTTAAGTADRLSIGTLNTTTMTAYWDSVAVDNAAFPAPPAAPATANAGPDQVGVEPWSTVTLSGSDTGTVTSRQWTQLTGTPVTLTGATTATATFTAAGTVAGETSTFRYTVNGSVFDDVAVTVLPASERIMIGGSWVPCRTRLVT